MKNRFPHFISDFFVSNRLEEYLGKQDIPDDEHVVVIGLGNIGFKVVQSLVNSGKKVVAIEKDRRRLGPA